VLSVGHFSNTVCESSSYRHWRIRWCLWSRFFPPPAASDNNLIALLVFFPVIGLRYWRILYWYKKKSWSNSSGPTIRCVLIPLSSFLALPTAKHQKNSVWSVWQPINQPYKHPTFFLNYRTAHIISRQLASAIIYTFRPFFWRGCLALAAFSNVSVTCRAALFPYKKTLILKQGLEAPLLVYRQTGGRGRADNDSMKKLKRWRVIKNKKMPSGLNTQRHFT